MNQPNLPASVNVTKLFRPPTPDDFVPRRRLSELLNLIRQRPLTIVSAPAGYGKTTTISAWLQQTGARGAWLTLEESDNGPNEFLACFLAALLSAAPLASADLQALLTDSGAVPVPTFLTALNAALNALGGDITLVLDEFQTITNPEILTLFDQWMRHPHPTLHLVLISRHDPALPLAHWRARNQIVDIRHTHLRFNAQEEEEFLRRAAGVSLGAEDVALLRSGTEGWPAALRLVALALPESGDLDNKEYDFSHMGRQDVMDYLASQVLDTLPAQTQEVLLKSSILEQMTGPLCDALLGDDSVPGNGQALLDELSRANVFLAVTSADGKWFRFHQLFRDFLHSRLNRQTSPQAIAELNTRAGQWLVAHGYLNEAIHHLVAAGEPDLILDTVARNRFQLMNEDRWQHLESWYRLLPEPVVSSSPDLLLIKGWLAHFRHFDMQEVDRVTTLIDPLLDTLDLEPERARQLAAETAVLRAVAAYFHAAPERAVDSCKVGLADLPAAHYVSRSYAWLFLAAAQQMLGHPEAAQVAIQHGRREDLAVPGQPRSRGTAAAGFVSWVSGDLAGVRQVGENILDIVSVSSQPQSVSWGHYFVAAAAYHQSRLDEALEHAQFAFDNRRLYHAHGAIQGGYIATLVHIAGEDFVGAKGLLRQLSEHAVWAGSEPLMALVQGMECELAVRAGRPQEALHWARHAISLAPLGAMPLFYAAPLTPPKVLLAAYEPRRRDELGAYLARLRAHVERIHQTRCLIEVLALEAMFHDRQGDERAALAALRQSLSLAQRSGFVRLYVDLGPQMQSLLARVAQGEPTGAFAARVRAAFPGPVRPRGNEALVEPLTDREVEVLGLLSERLSNKEIARQLFIAEATVKRHTINIYQKLGVSGRREAVQTAQSLGLLV